MQLRLAALQTRLQLDALVEGRLDAALIRPRPSYAAGLTAHLIHREAFCVALAADHPLARKDTLQAADLAEEAFVVSDAAEGTGLGNDLERLAAAGRFSIKIVHNVGGIITALTMAAGGYGVVLAPGSMRRWGFSEIVYRPLADFAATTEVAVAFRTAEPSASVRAFVDMAIAVAKRPEVETSSHISEVPALD